MMYVTKNKVFKAMSKKFIVRTCLPIYKATKYFTMLPIS